MTLHNPASLEDCSEIKLINPSKWILQGHSKAGERTGFLLKPIHVVLDTGMVTNKKPYAVFMSHAHTDHSHALPNMVNRRDHHIKGQEHLSGRPVYFPQDAHICLTKLLEAIIYLAKGKDVIITDPWKQCGMHPFPVNYGDVFEIPGIKNIKVEVLYADHVVQSVGYGFTSLRKKMKPEYIELSKTKEGIKQLTELKNIGTEIDYIQLIPEIAFYCDSSINNLKTKDEWKKYPVVIVECTGFPEYYTVDKMNLIKHTHFDDLIEIIKEHNTKQWVLIHTSMSVKSEYLIDLQKKIKEIDNKLNISFYGY